jgi:hypothetical protein
MAIGLGILVVKAAETTFRKIVFLVALFVGTMFVIFWIVVWAWFRALSSGCCI